MTPILQCQGLTKRYATKTALSNVTFTLERGKIVGLLGPNGSGKTTLIKLINGLLTPTQGNIYINNLAPCVETKKIVSYLPDKTYLDENSTVNKTIDMFADYYENFDANRAYSMLQALNINPNQRIKTLSKGTKEKVQLILVMSRNADLYVLDEPIGGVDPAARDYILQTIITNFNPNATILISTHLISDIESILDYVVFINQGQLVRCSNVDDIRTHEGKSVDELFREVFRC